MNTKELANLDATGQAELVRSGEAKPAELVEAAIERIERLNPQLNAVITPLFEQALEIAVGDLPDGPFTGVPYLLKDLIAEYAGSPLSEGTAFLRGGYVSKQDSELVTRLRRAGLIIVGKTNTPEFGLVPTTEPEAFGPTRNPWDPSRTPGGSSGGSAAAVASRMVPAAHGNDGGGSIRIPASCCGLFGLKPTRGRNPLGPKYGDLITGLAVEHALTLSVRDSAALLDATAGEAPGDPYSPPPPSRPFVHEVGADPGKLRIALTTETITGTPTHPDCIAAARDAGALCESLGHTVEEFSPDMGIDGDALTQKFTALFAAEAARTIDDWARMTGKTPAESDFEPLTLAAADMGRSTNAGDYLIALQDLQAATRTFVRSIAGFDLWLTPTLAEPPPPLGSFTSPDTPLFGWIRAGMFIPFTPLANYTGLPAVSVPLFWNEEDLPIGVQFVAKFGDEATLFRVGGQLEAARGWIDRRPQISA